MQRKHKLVLLSAVFVLLAVVPFISPTARGATSAFADIVRGKSALYRLGCVFGPSSDAVEFRFEELLAAKYNVYCETTGGFAPSDEIVKFTSAYNSVTMRLARLRYGQDFLDRTHAEARKDAMVQTAIVKGCYHPRSGRSRRSEPVDGIGGTALRFGPLPSKLTAVALAQHASNPLPDSA